MKSNKLALMLAVITVVRTFCMIEGDYNGKAAKEMNEWLVGKKVISSTSDASGGYGCGRRETCITIIAEVEEKK